MKKITKICVLAYLILTLSIPVTADSTASDIQSIDIIKSTSEKNIIKVYTVALAQETALKNNMQIVIDDLEVELKQKALIKAEDNAAMASDAYGAETVLNNRIRKEVRVMEAEAALETARMTKKDHNEQLKLQVSSSFYNILLARKELENEIQKLDILKERYEIVKKKYEAKSITIDALEAAEYDVFSKTIEVEAIKQKLTTLDIRLKELLGIPFDGEQVDITGEIVRIDFSELDTDKVVEECIDIDIGVYSAANRLNSASRIMEITEEIFRPDTETYIKNRKSLEVAMRDYEEAKRNREVNIRNGYNELLNLNDNIEVVLKYEELQKRKFDNIKIKYDKGQIDKEYYLSAESNYLDACFNKYKAICDFNINYESFRYLIRTD